MRRPPAYISLAVLLVAIAACSSSEEVFDDPIYPEKPVNTPPNIESFSPDSLAIDTEVGDTIRFAIAATDEEDAALEYEYTLGPSVVSKQSRWMYVVESSGSVDIRAVASDGSLADSVTWQVNRREPPDVTPPGPVTVEGVTVTSHTKNAATLFIVWRDLGHEASGGEASSYIVRYSEAPIANESGWLAATDVAGEPGPAIPGSLRNMVFTVPMFADRVWVAVRAVDAAGNTSPIGVPGSVGWEFVTGRVSDAVTAAPVEGATVSVGGQADLTGADGSYRVRILSGGLLFVRVRDELTTGPYGDYFDIDGRIDIVPGRHDFWLLPNLPLISNQYDDFLDFFWLLTVEPDRTLYGTRHLTWEIPFDVYVPSRTWNGIDLQQRMKDAYTVWEEITGRDLVTFVDSEPAVGVFVDWSHFDERSVYFVEERDDEHFPVKGRIQMESDFNPANLYIFDRVAVHEVGHSLILDHSTDGIHIMVGFRAIGVNAPNPDEEALMKAVYNIPRGTEIKHFKHD